MSYEPKRKKIKWEGSMKPSLERRLSEKSINEFSNPKTKRTVEETLPKHPGLIYKDGVFTNKSTLENQKLIDTGNRLVNKYHAGGHFNKEDSVVAKRTLDSMLYLVGDGRLDYQTEESMKKLVRVLMNVA